ncbi:isoamylase early set domain-containing protein [Dongshaea marina]|uniref:isoamylase early set domain-containing protein n=1 Tax=Dongshaea marina TaxID=2047966 RepID=UPI000D3E0534|nr:isoamylase early set domain-containing protein [Dongshaea marina]
MPVIKKFLKSRPEVKVTFEVDPNSVGDAKKVNIIAEFEQWKPIALKRLKSGSFKTTLNVPTDKQDQFQFRYQLIMQDGREVYQNDPQADGYIPNEYGEENSVLRVCE